VEAAASTEFRLSASYTTSPFLIALRGFEFFARVIFAISQCLLGNFAF